ncbi:MAG TPA: twin transmembrane helix small protein [Burkholderiaceae bacterium]|nr:twin transmembrane helix small protein [Burkholderiaceae bacterium]
MKYVIALAFVGILGALASAGVFMLRGGRDEQAKSNHMMRALALRVALSVLLFLFILLSYWLGWIEPGGVPLTG